ncbi:nicotinate phosphoribosyltransferase-like [Patiria miniata]|uniref:Nicotinate phosphoribosyltransferase n=1 Tax=Patiria miniata TaxID=46514 RepID=A0A913ZJ58_PATMI|nr:nicotinate phosphoribosyltransferase-like [Patiria miniata]XP_038051828.1 nicotinate phosphoribosyltransferase-like [Patiria miniata]
MAANNINNNASILESGQESNGIIQALLTDQYQITMAYAYWKSRRTDSRAVFDLFFRRNPFRGEFTIFAGLQECLRFLKNFRYTDSDIAFLRTVLPPTTERGFFDYLSALNCSAIQLYAIDEGSVVFPRVPLLRIEGPLPLVQLLETTLLNLINYASLVATNAARFRLASGPNKQLLEFGLRRAQGPDGGLSASKYSYIGGFDATSNVLAGKLYNIPLRGTNAHSLVMSFRSIDDLKNKMLQPKDATSDPIDLAASSLAWLDKVCQLLDLRDTNEGELASFIAYAVAFPQGFLVLVDTYDVLKSGVANFCAVSLALNDIGYKAVGVRIDSGDLAYQSLEIRKIFERVAQEFGLPWFCDVTIVASNDINEETLHSLQQQGNSIDAFGIGTHLVTCQKQPALGCVFKLVQIDDEPRIKLSHDIEKVTIPGRKTAYRLYGSDGLAIADLMAQPSETSPEAQKVVLCRHPFEALTRVNVRPTKVDKLHKLYMKDGEICQPLPTLSEVRDNVKRSMQTLRSDVKRELNPTPYKVSVTSNLYHFLHDLWQESLPVGQLS